MSGGSTSKAISNPISPFTAAPAKPSTSTRPSTTRSGGRSCPDADLPWGAFGENLTTAGLSEEDVHIGDRFGIGSAEFEVTQPRMPCFKLTIRFGRADMIKRFLRSGRSGFYLAVTKEGAIAAGDAISVIRRHPDAITIAEAAER